MKVYYEQDGILIYHGDCQEVLPSLAAESVDLVMTDPPYGIGLEYGGTQKDNWRPGRELWQMVARVMKPDTSLHMTVSNRHLAYWLSEVTAAGLEYAHCSVYWNRCRAIGNRCGEFAYAWEPWLAFAKGKVRLVGHMLSDVFPHVGKKVTARPAEKDFGTWGKYMNYFPGSVVLDPFLGSGTTLVAAKLLGRRGIGVDIEESACEMAARRLSQECFRFGGSEP